MGLDKFYTKPEMAKSCYNFLLENIPSIEEEYFLEPSAGDGSFLNFLNNYFAIDIAPEKNGIEKTDFLKWKPDRFDYVTIGNPPFGSRSKLAIEFFNKASKCSKVIAFIVPVSFMKWSVQKQLNENFALLNYFYLDKNSFLSRGKDYSIRTVFQIWVNRKSIFYNGIDKKLKKAPPIKHDDFLIWQHNATVQSRKTVDEDWEIATWRQGYKDYNNLFFRKDYEWLKNQVYTTNQQFFFIKPLTEEARKIILSMDFCSLAERNISTPGFGKGDFVSYYIELKEQLTKGN